MNSDGVIQTNRQSIADVFADFYTQLYACRDTGTTPSTSDLNEFEVVAAVTDEELQSILKTMANRNNADIRGVVVELPKARQSFPFAGDCKYVQMILWHQTR